ncbi:hypothetical protein CPC08DRAFT_629174 [Agrocybe pediades]|nr:hypothetical protein CPC08DRAFT_629174 [Agrocybe pediades]
MAAPALPSFSFPKPPSGLGKPLAGRLACDPGAAKLVLPTGQTALTAPTDVISYVLLGVGFQNYTCTDAGTYASAGAVADLFDISCLNKVPAIFNSIQDIAYTAWKLAPANVKTLGASAVGYPLLGQHFFATSPSGTGISPVWDFRATSAKGKADAFVLAAKVGNTTAPTGAKDVDWLQLKNVQGSLATQIYRTDTRGGPAPATCTPGSAPITVKYTSKYCESSLFACFICVRLIHCA